jgi:hypothetical protein
MAWGILMTALSLFGMMGLAIFEATWVELPSKPDVNREQPGADEPKIKKAA